MKLLSKRQRISDKKGNLYKTKRSQVIIVNIVLLVMALLVFMALIPVIKSQVDQARNYDSLNCKETDATRICNTNGLQTPCYNASYAKTETVACAMLDLYIPYIVIIVLLAGAAKLMANRMDSMFAPTPYA
jgi:hypothetical protein